MMRALKIPDDAWVAGNQELGLLQGAHANYCDGDARKVIIFHRQVCEKHPDILDQIKRMRIIAQPMPGVILAHGVPKPNDNFWTVTKYTETAADPEQAVHGLSAVGIHPRVIAVGHTHRACFWHRMDDRNADAKWNQKNAEAEVSLGDLDHQVVYLNPGSVGQPRDGSREAGYCYIDWDKMTVCFRRVSYPLHLTRAKMIELHYPEKLIHDWYSDSTYGGEK
jgi:predicted phosphodiesterase